MLLCHIQKSTTVKKKTIDPRKLDVKSGSIGESASPVLLATSAMIIATHIVLQLNTVNQYRRDRIL